jgi:hypothetical protein
VSTTPPAPDSSLGRLNAELDQLLAMFEQGNWEDIPNIENTLINALESVRQPQAGKVNDPGEIRYLLNKLGKAIDACSTRKQQIAPLVNALTKTQAKP